MRSSQEPNMSHKYFLHAGLLFLDSVYQKCHSWSYLVLARRSSILKRHMKWFFCVFLPIYQQHAITDCVMHRQSVFWEPLNVVKWPLLLCCCYYYLLDFRMQRRRRTRHRQPRSLVVARRSSADHTTTSVTLRLAIDSLIIAPIYLLRSPWTSINTRTCE